jgi:hypothetical protein
MRHWRGTLVVVVMIFAVTIQLGTGEAGATESGVASSLAAAHAVESHSIRAVTIKEASRHYLNDVAPFAIARTAYQTAFAQWHENREAPSVTASFVNPFVTACRILERKLKSQSWPGHARADVRALVASVSAVARDVSRLPSIDAATASAWGITLERDSATSTADANRVRSDLGLPPAV